MRITREVRARLSIHPIDKDADRRMDENAIEEREKEQDLKKRERAWRGVCETQRDKYTKNSLNKKERERAKEIQIHTTRERERERG